MRKFAIPAAAFAASKHFCSLVILLSNRPAAQPAGYYLIVKWHNLQYSDDVWGPTMSSKQAVQKWLVDSGYPLEMQVAAAFQKKGWLVYQSDFYVDPETKEPREIDVVSLDLESIGDTLHWLEIALQIECKRSPQKPWVLFLGSRPTAQHLFQHIPATSLSEKLLSKAREALSKKSLPLFHSTHVAYGMAQALRSKEGSDDCYKALMQSVKATRASIEQDELLLSRMTKPPSLDFAIALPVIVVDGDLYTAELDDQGTNPVLKQVQHQVLLWRNPIGGRRNTAVHIVSRSHLQDFVLGARTSMNELLTWCTENLPVVEQICVDHLEKRP